MKHYTAETSGSIYRQQLCDLVDRPDHIVTVRGRPTRELLNVVTEITNPRARIQIVPGRKLNPFLALSEALWLLAGRDDVAALLPYNKRITLFSDDGLKLYGAYGKRLAPQIPALLERLRQDPNDRRAVLNIWRPEDLIAVTKDPPCNSQLMFKLRDDKLYMTVICRSNDLHWGLHAVNLIQFSVLQEYLACRLGCAMGSQIHFSDSLHIYTDAEGQKITDRMLAALDEPINPIPAQSWLFTSLVDTPYEEFQRLCSAPLDNGPCWNHPFLEFASDFLRSYREKKELEPRHADRYEAWVRMGVEFLSR